MNKIGSGKDFTSFIKGTRDSFLISSKEVITKKDYFNFLEFIYFLKSFFYKGTIFFFGYKKSIFVTSNKKKEKFIESFKEDLVFSSQDQTRFWGYLLDYPECCVEKYVGDLGRRGDLKEGYRPARRYLKQLKELKIEKDVFNVKIRRDCIEYTYFIPCHPKCKKALKLLRNWKK
jgi:hypothetical protein